MRASVARTASISRGEPPRFAGRSARLGEGGEIGASGEPPECGRNQGAVAGVDADHRAAGGNRPGSPDEAVAVEQQVLRGIGQQRLEGDDPGVPEGGQGVDVVPGNRGLDREVDQARPFAGRAHGFDAGDGVGGGIGIGHAHHGGHPARRRRQGAGRESLLVRIAGIAHVHMGVDEAREQEPPARVDHGFGPRPGAGVDKGGNPTVVADDDTAGPHRRPGHQLRVVYREQRHAAPSSRLPADYAISGPR